jgi:hypothetical protein
MVVGYEVGAGGLDLARATHLKKGRGHFLLTRDRPKFDRKYREAEVLSTLKYFVNSFTA